MRGVAVTAVLLVAAASQAAASGAVSIQATSATVANPGDAGSICVVLTTGGNDVAGTQNDLTWDGTCATLPDPPPCQEAGTHNKRLRSGLVPSDSFRFRGLVLSLSDVNPMPDGPLYCCTFQGEADPGQCCAINVVNTGASDPNGKAISPVIGNSAKICTANAPDQPGQAIGSINSGQPLSASNAPTGGGMGGGSLSPQAPPAPAPGGGAPVAQVLAGGGARVENTPAAEAAPAAIPALRLPTPPVAPVAAAAPTGASAPQPPLPPQPTLAQPAATSAPTPAPTAPAEQPTTVPTVAATAAPTKAAAPPKQDQVKPGASSDAGGGWFGCQIAAGASAIPVLGLGLLGLVGVAVRRRRNARR